MEREWNDSQPIYRQLRDRVVAMILDGVLNEGDPLPSVRNVAAEYRVNPITVLKGYQELVERGARRDEARPRHVHQTRRARSAAAGGTPEVPRRGVAPDLRDDPAARSDAGRTSGGGGGRPSSDSEKEER